MSDLSLEMHKLGLKESVEAMKAKLDEVANELIASEPHDEKLERTLGLIEDLKDKYSSFLEEAFAL